MRLLAKLLEKHSRDRIRTARTSLRSSSGPRIRWLHSPLTKLFAENARGRIRTGARRSLSLRSSAATCRIRIRSCSLTRFLTSFENSFSARDRIRTGGPLRDSVLSALPFKCPLWRSRWRAPKITRDARSRCARALAGVWRTLASRGLACIAIVSPRTIKVTRGTAFCDTTVRRPLSRRSPRFQSGPAVCIDNPSPIANR